MFISPIKYRNNKQCIYSQPFIQVQLRSTVFPLILRCSTVTVEYFFILFRDRPCKYFCSRSSWFGVLCEAFLPLPFGRIVFCRGGSSVGTCGYNGRWWGRNLVHFQVFLWFVEFFFRPVRHHVNIIVLQKSSIDTRYIVNISN